MQINLEGQKSGKKNPTCTSTLSLMTAQFKGQEETDQKTKLNV